MLAALQTAPLGARDARFTMRLLQGHRWAVRAVAYPPGDPATLASAGDDALIRLWNVTTGEQWGSLPGHRSGTLALAFSPSGAQLASAGRDGHLRLWDMAAQREAEALGLRYGPLGTLAFAPDGRAVLTAPTAQRLGQQGLFYFWQPARHRHSYGRAWGSAVRAVAFAPEGDVVAVASERRIVALWDHRRFVVRGQIHCAHAITQVAFAPPEAGPLLAVAAGTAVELWDVTTQERRAVFKGHKGRVRAVAFGPDGRTVLSGAADHTVRWWDTASGRPLASWDWKLGRVFTVAVAPDGTTAAAGGEKPGVVVWDLD
jgi:WD40 repeat protein